jgi:hypothetical protein
LHFQKQTKQEAIAEAEKLNLSDNHFYLLFSGDELH